MARGKAVTKKAYAEPRLDSGAALSDPAALSHESGPNSNFVMSILRKTNWDYGTPKARYRKNELQLRQPKGFPIIPLKSTLDRARKKSVTNASTGKHTGSNFEIYDDLEELDEVEEEDEYAEVEYEDEEAQGSAYDSVDSSGSGSDGSVDLPDTQVIAGKPAALVDSRGRTRAATNRRKTQGASDCTVPTSFSSEDQGNATAGNKERRRSNTRASKKFI